MKRCGPRSGCRALRVAGLIFWAASGGAASAADRPADERNAVQTAGELKQWHKVTLTFQGPFARERDTEPNPFTDYRLAVTFAHESGAASYRVPGFFAADGRAGETSAEEGDKWRVHFAPCRPGRWTWQAEFVRGPQVGLGDQTGEPVPPIHGRRGEIAIQESDKQGRDFRAHGRLGYVGRHHLQFAGSGQYFLKAGADAPETFLAYADFDGTAARRPNVPLKTWEPHVRDWRSGDPTWQSDKGKGILGALNYLAGTGCNAVSFLTYNAGGDGDNVWPFAERNLKLHYDCSKLDQWDAVFDHATAQGIYLHFKLQEQENDDDRLGNRDQPGTVPESLDGGDLGPERKLYLRELIARFGHNLALNWNLGEENTQTAEQQRAMAGYIHDLDPYDHLIVVHTFPNWQDRVYPELLGDRSVLSGASLQNHWDQTHRQTLRWVTESAGAGRPWVVANDEQGPADLGVPPDPGYQGYDSVDRRGQQVPYSLHDIRKATLWGNLMAGGAGIEYYFGYQLPENDLNCQDWRSRARSWDYCRIALEFFRDQAVPFWEMANANALVGNKSASNERFCLAKAGEIYLVYLADGGAAQLNLAAAPGSYQVRWFDPRNGGPLQEGSLRQVQGGRSVELGEPPADAGEDWLIVVRKQAL